MPPPTHCNPAHPQAGLLPYTSVSKALSEIPLPLPHQADSPPLDPMHNLQVVAFLPNRHLPSWDAHKILPRAMTTSGGQNYHPSGTRDLTLREYATLQGFPQNHVFEGNGVKKQIGNAVPPCVAKVLFGWIRKELEAADGVVDGEVEILE
jgi:DNA (cytosine-5)-methyltransferase 1